MTDLTRLRSDLYVIDLYWELLDDAYEDMRREYLLHNASNKTLLEERSPHA